MATWTNITNALVGVGARPFATTLAAFRDNVVAAFQGAAGAPRLVDAALDSTVTNDGRNWVRNRMAVNPAGAVGTYSLLLENDTNIPARVRGDTLSGAKLSHMSLALDPLAQTLIVVTRDVHPAGTWELHGDYSTSAFENDYVIALWKRIG